MPGSVLSLDLTHTLHFNHQPNWSDLVPSNANCSYGIQWIWELMGQCVMDTQSLLAVICGFVCLIVWILNGIPQMIENFRTGIPDQAMSPFLLLFWFLGDLSNLVGCILTRQLILQVVISVYSIANDLVLCSQFIYYKMRHKLLLSRITEELADGHVSPDESSLCSESEVDPLIKPASPPDSSNRTRLMVVSTLGVMGVTTMTYLFPKSQSPLTPISFPHDSFSSRRLLSYGTPVYSTVDPVVSSPFLPGVSVKIGYSLGWISSVMYLSSRIPQIYQNLRRGSTEGLCIGLFCLAVIGNIFYALQIFLTSLDAFYLLRSLPWLVGSLGVLLLDFLIFFQFYYYSRPKYRNQSMADRVEVHPGSSPGSHGST